jgi:hypothetical protein
LEEPCAIPVLLRASQRAEALEIDGMESILWRKQRSEAHEPELPIRLWKLLKTSMGDQVKNKGECEKA